MSPFYIRITVKSTLQQCILFTDIPLSCSADPVIKPSAGRSHRMVHGGYSNPQLSGLAEPSADHHFSTPLATKTRDSHENSALSTSWSPCQLSPQPQQGDFRDVCRVTCHDGCHNGCHRDCQTDCHLECNSDFPYEDSVDELLEYGLLQRDDTFESITDTVTALPSFGDAIESSAKSAYNSTVNSSPINNNSDGVCSESNDLVIDEDRVKSDVLKHSGRSNNVTNLKPSKLKRIDDQLDLDKDTAVISRSSLQYLERKLNTSRVGNTHDSIDTGYGSGSREIDSDSLSSEGILDDTNDHTSDIELEWDNDPSTEMLTVDNQKGFDDIVTEGKPNNLINEMLTTENLKKPDNVGDQRKRELLDEVRKINSVNNRMEFYNVDRFEKMDRRRRVSEMCDMENQAEIEELEDFASRLDNGDGERDWMSMSLCVDNDRAESNGTTDLRRSGSSRVGLNKGLNSHKAFKRRSRSLADIEISLDEKVTLLREEKTYVQRKIQESIYEERIRVQQGKVLKGLSQPERKEVMLKTLYDLKTRLEDQSERLQSSYSTILTLRKRFSQRKGSRAPLETDV